MKHRMRLRKGLLIVLGAAVLLSAAFLAAWNNTSIPKLDLIGNISAMEEKDDERVISFQYDDGQQIRTGYAEIKMQGNSSLAYEKKNYTIKLYSDSECKDKLLLDLGWGKENKYCLKANWVDRTQARNVVTANPTALAQKQYGVLLQAPNHGLTDGFPVEIYSNGQFLGFRQFREAIPRMSFAKEILRWGSGLVRRRGDLPNFERNIWRQQNLCWMPNTSLWGRTENNSGGNPGISGSSAVLFQGSSCLDGSMVIWFREN